MEQVIAINQESEKGRTITMKPVYATDVKEPARAVNFTKIFTAPKPQTKLTLAVPRKPENDLRLLRGPRSATLHLQPAKRAPGQPVHALPLENKRFSVPRASGNISRAFGTSELEKIGVADLNLPPGVPRFVNAATLKRMLKADPADLLLKKVRNRWEICEDSVRVDLLDDSVEFRIGAIQIYS